MNSNEMLCARNGRLACFPPRTRNHNLHRLGVNDKRIQAILRHSNVSTTMNIYVKPVSTDSTAAMKLLESALCANCAPEATPTAQRMLN